MVLFVLLIPIWTVPNLPLTDYPHALARGYISSHYSNVSSFRSLYYPAPRFVPDMGLEALAALCGPSVDIFLLGKILISIGIILFCYGCHRIVRIVHGSPSWKTFISSFFIYSAVLIYGAMNTLLGLSFFLVAFSFWLEWHRERPFLIAIVSIPILIVLTLVHLSTLAFSGLSIVLITTLERTRKELTTSQWIALVTPLLFPVFVLLTFLHHGGTLGTIEYGTFFGKLSEHLSLFTTFRHTFDALYMVCLIIAIVIAILRRTGIAYNSTILFLGLAFYAMLWLCPNRLFTSGGADIRFLLPAVVLILSSISIEVPKRLARVLFAIVLGLNVIRIAVIFSDWHTMSGSLGAQYSLMEKIPKGSRLFPVTIYSDTPRPKMDLGTRNGHCYSVIFRHADDLALDAYPWQHAVAFRTPTGFCTFDGEQNFTAPTLDSIRAKTDYIWCFHPQPFLIHTLSIDTNCEFIDSAGGAYLWKVKTGTTFPTLSQISPR